MSLATFCVIVGIWELVFGLPLLLRPAAFMRRVELLLGEESLVRLVSFSFLVIAVLTLSRGAAVSADQVGVVRLLAWVTALKCLPLCWWPQRARALAGWWMKRAGLGRLMGLLAVAMGAWLLWLGGSL